MSSSDSSSISSEPVTSPTITHKRDSGRKKFRETRHPIYRGVRQRNGGKWVCEMRLNNSNSKSRLWLGTHITPEMAARAHDVAALALKGKSAQLNFADSAWLLPLPKSSAHSDIQSAALAAAHAYRPNAKSSSPSFASTSSVETLPNTPVESPANLFFDEEAVFNMPSLLTNMAEGMLLTPPFMDQQESNWNDSCLDLDMNMSLWSL